MQNRLFNRTKLQLAGWYAAVMGVILGICGFATYHVVINAYFSAVDQELKAVTETLHNGIEFNLQQPGILSPIAKQLLPDLCPPEERCPAPIADKHEHRTSSGLHILGTIRQGDYYIQFLNLSGKPVAVSGLRPEGLPVAPSSELWQTLLDRNGDRYHQMSLELHTSDQQLWGYLLVGRSLKDVDRQLATLKTAFFIGLPIIVLLVGGSSWWLAGLAMRPIYRSYQQMQRFTADAAHELRTPLTAILATVDSGLRMLVLTEPETREILKTIERQSSRFIELVNDLLLLARLEQHTLLNQLQLVFLNDLIQDLVEEFSALAETNHIQLEATIQTSKPLCVLADEDQIYRLVTNLIVNAIQYTPKAGKITLTLGKTEHYAVIRVQDTGIGIAVTEQKQIFDRFYRVDSDRSRQTGGSGLGLAIAKAIAQAHRGSLSVQSELGKGSTFIVRLPLQPASHSASINRTSH
jgi:signal transduction histidine kinase